MVSPVFSEKKEIKKNPETEQKEVKKNTWFSRTIVLGSAIAALAVVIGVVYRKEIGSLFEGKVKDDPTNNPNGRLARFLGQRDGNLETLLKKFELFSETKPTSLSKAAFACRTLYYGVEPIHEKVDGCLMWRNRGHFHRFSDIQEHISDLEPTDPHLGELLEKMREKMENAYYFLHGDKGYDTKFSDDWNQLSNQTSRESLIDPVAQYKGIFELGEDRRQSTRYDTCSMRTT